MSITVEIRGEYIQLDQLLKTTGLCHSGGYAHAEIEAGNVLVDGAVETRKRAKLRPGLAIRAMALNSMSFHISGFLAGAKPSRNQAST